MSMPISSTQQKTLDYTYKGLPFVQEARVAQQTLGLEVTHKGLPFIAEQPAVSPWYSLESASYV